MPAAKPDTTRWVTATVLLALARRCLVEGGTFTAEQLQEMLQGQLTPTQRTHATSRLCTLGFVEHGIGRDTQGRQVDTYRVTAEGAAAIEAAGQGHVRKSGPKGERRPNPVKPQAISTRLWALMRMRRMLDSDSAAQLLCDAGEQDFKRVQATVRRTLARWATTPQVKEASRRVPVAGQSVHSNGCKRYVLVEDSLEPPRWRQLAKEQAA